MANKTITHTHTHTHTYTHTHNTTGTDGAAPADLAVLLCEQMLTEGVAVLKGLASASLASECKDGDQSKSVWYSSLVDISMQLQSLCTATSLVPASVQALALELALELVAQTGCAAALLRSVRGLFPSLHTRSPYDSLTHLLTVPRAPSVVW